MLFFPLTESAVCLELRPSWLIFSPLLMFICLPEYLLLSTSRPELTACLEQQSPDLWRKLRNSRVYHTETDSVLQIQDADSSYDFLSSPTDRGRNECVTRSSWPEVWNLDVWRFLGFFWTVSLLKPAANNLLIIFRGKNKSGKSLSQWNDSASSVLLLFILRL